MLEHPTLSALREQHWTVTVNDANTAPHRTPLVVLWKPYANGVAVTLSLHAEEGQVVVYTDVGHAGAGSNRTEAGRFATVDAAIDQLIQACNRWDSTWET